MLRYTESHLVQQTQKQPFFWRGGNWPKQDDNEEGANKKSVYKSLKLWVCYLTKKLSAQEYDIVQTLKRPEQFLLPQKKKLKITVMSSLHNTQKYPW